MSTPALPISAPEHGAPTAKSTNETAAADPIQPELASPLDPSQQGSPEEPGPAVVVVACADDAAITPLLCQVDKALGTAEFERASTLLVEAETRVGGLSAVDRRAVAAELATRRSELLRRQDEFLAAIEQAVAAEALAGANYSLASRAKLARADAYTANGDYRLADVLYGELLRANVALDSRHLAAKAMIGLARVRYLCGDLVATSRLIVSAKKLVDSGTTTEGDWAYFLRFRARCKQLDRRFVEAHALLLESAKLERGTGNQTAFLRDPNDDRRRLRRARAD